MAVTRIKNNQITDATITFAKIAAGTLTGSLFNANLTLNSNVSIIGNFSVSGTPTTINSVNTYVNDPVVVFNNGYAGSLVGYDIGLLVNRNLSSLAPYGSVNAFWGWVENDAAFEAIATTDTGTGITSINNSGFANLKVGNIFSQSGTITASTVTAATIGNSGTTLSGTLSAAGVSGTVATANVSQYDSVTPFTTTANFFPQFSNISTAGNTVGGVATNLVFNPGSGNLFAGSFVGSGIYLTGVAAASAGNTAFYACTAPYTTSQVFYPMFSNLVSAGNTTHGVATNLSFNPGTANLTIGNIALTGNAISSLSGTVLGLGAIGNVSVTGGTSGYTVITNGAGVLSFNPGNALVLGSNSSGQLVSNAITLTSTTNVTDAIAQLNQILGKLTPAAPPNFPGNVATSVGAASTFSITTGTTSAIMTGDAARGTGWTQQNNISGNTYQLAGGTTFSAVRANTIATSTLAAIKSGQGNVRSWYGGNIITGFVNLTGALGTVTNGNLSIVNDTDYNNIKSTVSAGFWYSANVSISATAGMLPGWNSILIEDLGGYTNGNTNSLLWYNDISSTAAGTPTFSNTSAVLTTNVVAYSSSIPHFTSGAVFRLKGNVNNLSGDTYPTGNVNLTSATAAAGGFQAPTAVPYTAAVASAGYWSGTVPLPRYLCNTTYGSGTSAYYETNSSIVTTGFGSSTSGPTLTVTNGYNASLATAHQASGAPTILWKNGTGTAIDETTIPVNSVGTGSGNGFRVASQGSSNNPVYVAGNVSSPIWNSQTTTLQTYDAVVVGSGSQGIIAWSQTNFSTGYLPVGPNLSGQATTQYFTMKFIRTAVSKFNIKYSGTIAGLWVALPGGSPNGTDTYASPTNGWLDVSVTYAGEFPAPAPAATEYQMVVQSVEMQYLTRYKPTRA